MSRGKSEFLFYQHFFLSRSLSLTSYFSTNIRLCYVDKREVSQMMSQAIGKIKSVSLYNVIAGGIFELRLSTCVKLEQLLLVMKLRSFVSQLREW